MKILVQSKYLLLITLILLVSTKSVEIEGLKFLSELSFLENNSTSIGFGIKCFWLDSESMSVYDLNALKRPKDQQSDYNFKISDNQIFYNFCGNTLSNCSNTLSQVSVFEGNSSCSVLSGPIRNGNKWEVLSSPQPGLKITLGNGTECKTNQNENYTIEYILQCNSEMENGKFNLINAEKFNVNSCKNVLEFESKEACARTNFYVVWEILDRFKALFGSLFIVIGLFETFLGLKLVIITMFIISFFSVVTTFFLFMFGFILVNGSNAVVFWVGLVISIILGILLGYVVTKLHKLILAMILGGNMGFIIGIILYIVLFSHFSSSPMLIFILTVLFSMITCIVISYFVVTGIIIFATATYGAFLFIRGIAILAGGYPNEFYVIDLIRNDEDTLSQVLTPVIFAYFAGWILICAVGIFFQIKTNKEKEIQDIDESSTDKPKEQYLLN